MAILVISIALLVIMAASIWIGGKVPTRHDSHDPK